MDYSHMTEAQLKDELQHRIKTINAIRERIAAINQILALKDALVEEIQAELQKRAREKKGGK